MLADKGFTIQTRIQVLITTLAKQENQAKNKSFGQQHLLEEQPQQKLEHQSKIKSLLTCWG